MFKRLFIAVLLVFTMAACDNKTTEIPTTAVTYHSITLENEYNDLNQLFKDIAYGEVLTLPVDEIEGKVFVGWSDGENIYNNSLTVETSLALEAIYEDVTEVFEYILYPEVNEISITGYTGNSKYLRIPKSIDGYIVKGIAANAFESSPIIEVELPKTISRIYQYAFYNAIDLEKVSFYGNYFGTKELIISKAQYDVTIEDYSGVCQISEYTEEGWKFTEGCPIKEVLDGTEPIIIGGQEYYNYRVLYDLAIVDLEVFSLMIDALAFTNLPKLETFEFPERFDLFLPECFSNTPSLVNLTFNDNNFYYSRDNIVYRRLSANPLGIIKYELVYYPPGLTAKEYTIPATVETIRSYSFRENNYLEIVNIGSHVKNIGFSAFSNNKNLKEINMEENNSSFYTIDGVLYYNDTLLNYPMAKEDKNFIVPENVDLIAPWAFYGQRFLESISLNAGLKQIGYSAFSKVEKISLLNIPSSVELIDAFFVDESSIEVVIINRSLVTDGSITNIRSPRNDYTPIFYVPDDSYDDYRTNQNWSLVYEYIKKLSEFEIEG